MKTVLLIGLLIVLTVVIIVVCLLCYSAKTIMDKGGMTDRLAEYAGLKYIEWTYSGDSEDSFKSRRIEHFDKYDLLTVVYKPSHNQEKTETKYKLPNDTLKNCIGQLIKYNYKNWADLDKSDMFTYDAGVERICFCFEPDIVYTIDEYSILPKKEEMLFAEINDFFETHMPRQGADN